MSQQPEPSSFPSPLIQIISLYDDDEVKFFQIFNEALELRRRKGHDYGKNSWKGLGARGEFPYLYHKTLRLKSLLWDGKAPTFEDVRTNLFDLFNYVLHTTLLFDEEHNATSNGSPHPPAA